MNKRQKQLIKTYFRKRAIAVDNEHYYTKWETIHFDVMENNYSNEELFEMGIKTIHSAQYLLYMKNPDYDLQMKIANYEPYFFKYTNNQHPDVVKYLLDKTAYNIRYINNPTEEQIKYALSKKPEVIKYIENPSKELIIHVLFNFEYNNHVDFLHRIVGKHPSNELKQLAKVLSFPFAISKIENPSELVQLGAINKNVTYISYIKNPSKKVIRKAIDKEPTTIMFIEDLSYDDFKYTYDNHYSAIEKFLQPKVLPQIKEVNKKLYQYLMNL